MNIYIVKSVCLRNLILIGSGTREKKTWQNIWQKLIEGMRTSRIQSRFYSVLSIRVHFLNICIKVESLKERRKKSMFNRNCFLLTEQYKAYIILRLYFSEFLITKLLKIFIMRRFLIKYKGCWDSFVDAFFWAEN